MTEAQLTACRDRYESSTLRGYISTHPDVVLAEADYQQCRIRYGVDNPDGTWKGDSWSLSQEADSALRDHRFRVDIAMATAKAEWMTCHFEALIKQGDLFGVMAHIQGWLDQIVRERYER